MDFAHLATDTDGEFSSASVTLLEGLMNAAMLERGNCILGLSGGSTPRPVYEALGKSQEIDWQHVWLFLVDERYVPTGNPESNTKLIQETLLAIAALPPMQFKHPADLPLEEWQQEYEKILADLLKGKWPDIVILGMGEDGHIASLFPPVSERGMGPELTVRTTTDRFEVQNRISVTLPVLTNARSKIFLLRGKEKKKIWEEMLADDSDERRWPAKAILASGNVTLVTQW